MTKIITTIQCIIREIDDVNNQPKNPIRSGEGVGFPGFVTTDSGNSLILNKSIDKKIYKVADCYFGQQSSIQKKFTKNEWRAIIRKIVGCCYDVTDPENALSQRGEIFKQHLKISVKEYISAQCTYLMSFSCSLFRRSLISEFRIGPVAFLPSRIWLNYAFQNGHIEKAEHEKMMEFIAGSELISREELREQLSNKMVFDMVSNSGMICTVRTEGLAPELARKRSLIAARLAQASIALLWQRPSRILQGMHVFGKNPTIARKILVSTPDIGFGRRFAYNFELVNVSYVDCNNIEQIPSYDRRLFELAGKMISCWTSATEYEHASELLRGLSQSLFFFWSGCNDAELMSIVKFTASMEALVPNGKYSGVLSLLESRLNIKRNDEIAPNLNLQQMVKLIYSKARSRTLHGTNNEILNDWSQAKDYAEIISRECLVSSMYHLIHDQTETELRCLSN